MGIFLLLVFFFSLLLSLLVLCAVDMGAREGLSVWFAPRLSTSPILKAPSVLTTAL